MEVVKRKLADESGEIALRGSVILIIFIILLLGVLQVIHAYNTVSEVKEKTNEAVLAALASNASNIYDGVRESTWNARQYEDGNWESSVDTSQVLNQLVISTGGVLTSTDEIFKEESYQITDLSTSCQNTEDDGLIFTTTAKLEIFFHIGSIIDVKIPLNLEVVSTYDTKY